MCILHTSHDFIDGVDYTGKSSVVSFPAGETRAVCPIDTTQDFLAEHTDYFKATLSRPLNGPVDFGTPTMAFVRITDDDGKLCRIYCSV